MDAAGLHMQVGLPQQITQSRNKRTLADENSELQKRSKSKRRSTPAHASCFLNHCGETNTRTILLLVWYSSDSQIVSVNAKRDRREKDKIGGKTQGTEGIREERNAQRKIKGVPLINSSNNVFKYDNIIGKFYEKYMKHTFLQQIKSCRIYLPGRFK
jgi:hypothetical protein